MTTQLNPNAPEYNPIQPGIAPYPQATLPFILSPPPSTAGPRPWSSFSPRPPHQILPYLPSAGSHNTQRQLYFTTYPTYCVAPQNPVYPNPPNQFPPPSMAVSAPFVVPGRGSSQRRGRWPGGGRGGRGDIGREKSRVGISEIEQCSKRGLKKNEENKHIIVPLKRDEEQTTVMIKNIPYDCLRKELMGMLDDFCSLQNEKAENEGTSREAADKQPISYAYDFLYLPIDFRTKKSRGFAFVNFTSSRALWKFFESFHLKNWDSVERSKWPQKIEVVSAKIQGKEALVGHFSQSVFECETDEFLPLSFSPARDGSGEPIELTVVGIRRSVGRWKSRYNNNHKA